MTTWKNSILNSRRSIARRSLWRHLSYYRPTVCSVTNIIRYSAKEVRKDSVRPENGSRVCHRILMPSSTTYTMHKWTNSKLNAVDLWESSGWISDVDPYGWFFGGIVLSIRVDDARMMSDRLDYGRGYSGWKGDVQESTLQEDFGWRKCESCCEADVAALGIRGNK